MSTDGLEPQEQKIMDECVGKRIVAYSKGAYRGDNNGHWVDEEPLELILDDGSVLSIQAYGWHASGGLGIELANPSPEE